MCPLGGKGKSCSKALPECSDKASLGPDDHPDTGEVQQAEVDDCMEIPPSVEDIGKWDGDPFAAEMEAAIFLGHGDLSGGSEGKPKPQGNISETVQDPGSVNTSEDVAPQIRGNCRELRIRHSGAASRLEKAKQQLFERQAIEDIAARLTKGPGNAADRLAALRQRVNDRSARVPGESSGGGVQRMGNVDAKAEGSRAPAKDSDDKKGEGGASCHGGDSCIQRTMSVSLPQEGHREPRP